MAESSGLNFDITNFKGNFGTGARSYLFYWSPDWPEGLDVDVVASDVKFLARSTNMPGDTVEEIIVNWQGADLKLPGKRTFDDWTITLNVDRKLNIRRLFESWMKNIHNLVTGAYGLNDDYVKSQNLQMLNYDGSESIRNVKLTDAWIKSVSPIELDYANQEIAQFDVTFGYLHHTVTKTDEANAAA